MAWASASSTQCSSLPTSLNPSLLIVTLVFPLLASHSSFFQHSSQANPKFRTLAIFQPEQSCPFHKYGSSLLSFLPNFTGLAWQEALPDDPHLARV